MCFLCSIFILASETHVQLLVHAFLMFFFFLICIFIPSEMHFLYLFFLVFIENDKVFCGIDAVE